jgi:hypothetical protein
LQGVASFPQNLAVIYFEKRCDIPLRPYSSNLQLAALFRIDWIGAGEKVGATKKQIVEFAHDALHTNAAPSTRAIPLC